MKKFLVIITLLLYVFFDCYGQEGYQNDAGSYADPYNTADQADLTMGVNNALITGVGNSFYNSGPGIKSAASQLKNMTFLKAGYNVDVYSGTGSFNLPLHDVNFDNVSLNVGLFYNATGVRTRQYATETGLGWTINYGPTLTRIVRDKDDFQERSSFTQCDIKYLFGNEPEDQGSGCSYSSSTNYCYNTMTESFPDLFAQNIHSKDPSCYSSNVNVTTLCPSNSNAGICNLPYSLFNDASNPSGQPNNPNNPTPPSQPYTEDLMSDLFVANLNGDLVEFMWDRVAQQYKITNGKPYVISQPNSGAYVTNATYGKYFSNITITNDKGISYYFGYDPATPANFGKYLETTTSTACANIDPGYPTTISCPVGSTGNNVTTKSYISSWKINSITSANQQKAIFTYSNPNTINIEDNITQVFWMFDPSATCYSTCYSITNSTSSSTNTSSVIQSIIYPEGTISFAPTTNARYDFNSFPYISQISVSDFNGNLVKSFSLNYDYFAPYSGSNGATAYNNNNGSASGLLWLRNNLRLKLTGVSQNYTDSQVPALLYNFFYDETTPLPSRNSYIEDHWGFYNKRLSKNNTPYTSGAFFAFYPPSLNFCSNYPTPSSVRQGSFKEPDGSLMGSFILNRVVQPTQGSTSITYEPNDYYSLSRNANKTVGGLRVKRIDYKDQPGNVLRSTNYSYTLAGSSTSSGVLLDDKLYIKIAGGHAPDTTHCSTPCGPTQTCNLGYTMSPMSFLTPLNANGDIVGYSRVTISESNNGYSERLSQVFPIFHNYQYPILGILNCNPPYQYSDNSSQFPNTFRGVSDMSKYYSYVVQSQLYGTKAAISPHYLNNCSFSETVTVTDVNGNTSTLTDPYFYYHYLKNGLPVADNIYRNNNSLVSSIKYNYNVGTLPQQALYKIGELIAEQVPVCNSSQPFIVIYKSFVPVRTFFLTSKTTSSYDQLGQNALNVTEVYQRDSPNHNYPTRIYSTKNNNQVKGGIYLYPPDYASAGSGASLEAQAITAMAARNINFAPIEQVTFIANCAAPCTTTVPAYSTYNLVDARIPTYNSKSTPNGNIIVPATNNKIALNRLPFSSYTFSNRTAANIDPFSASSTSFQNYVSSYPNLNNTFVTDVVDNNGKVLQSHIQYDVPVSTIWGYNGEQPIANIKGAAISQVAYTSFEEANSGGWNHGSFPSTTDAWTGKSYYQGTTSPIVTTSSFVPIAGTGKYKISFYARAGSATSVLVKVNDAQQTVNIPAGSIWQYYSVYLNPTSGGPASITPATTSVQLDELRIHPSDSKMTTQCYLPLIGTITECNENSIPTYYEYDNLGRLSNERNQDRSILKHYDYNFKTY